MANNVIVLGCGRGGTSLAAGLIAGSPAGYDMGDHLVEPRQANPRGFFESRVINAINEDIMAPAMDLSDPHTPQRKQLWLATLPLDVKLHASNDVQRQMADVCAHEPFCYKDPRFCYTLDVWQPMLARTVFLCVFRDPAATAASIVKEVNTAPYLSSLSMNADQALRVWTCMYEHVLTRHAGQGDNFRGWLFVHVNQLFDEAGLDRVEQHIDAAVNRSFPERSLQRSRGGVDLPDSTRRVYEQLCDRAGYATGTA
jgi:hypothetical protein